MDNKLRKITLIIIASLAIIASLISIGSLAITLLEFVKDMSLDSLTSSLNVLITYGIDLLFAFFEISFGSTITAPNVSNSFSIRSIRSLDFSS